MNFTVGFTSVTEFAPPLFSHSVLFKSVFPLQVFIKKKCVTILVFWGGTRVYHFQVLLLMWQHERKGRQKIQFVLTGFVSFHSSQISHHKNIDVT